MNYLALAGAILLAIIALESLSRIIKVGLFSKRFKHGGTGFFLNALSVSCFGTAAVALGSLV